MHTTRNKKTICRTAFVLVVFFTTVCMTEADIPRSIFYTNWGNLVRLIKMLFALAMPMIMVWLDYRIERNLHFIAKASGVILGSFSVFYLLDMLTFNFNSNHGFNYSIYHIVFSTASAFGIMLMCVIIQLRNRNCDIGFSYFYKRYFDGLAIMLIMIFLFSFVISRIKSNYYYEQVYTNNFVPFCGEIKDLFSNFYLFGLLRTSGNTLLFTALSLTVIRYSNKHKMLFGIAVPFGLSILIEVSELVLNTGSFDVDDLIINLFGAVLGIVVHKLIFAKFIAE